MECFEVKDMGGVKFLKHHLRKNKITGAMATSYGYRLQPEGRVIVRNEAMRPRAEKVLKGVISRGS